MSLLFITFGKHLLFSHKLQTMKINFFLASFLIFLSGTCPAQTEKKFYSVTSGELIFSGNHVEFTNEFQAQNPEAEVSNSNMRFTMFFHLGQYWHYDINNHVGFLSGLGVRNTGLITDERLQAAPGPGEPTEKFKIIRRQYLLGIPFALKVGTFKDHLYFFGGGEVEMAFHYKEKYWNAHSRSGSKTGYSRWFGNQSSLLMPSVFGGVQFPGGINIKFKYYLSDFLNHDYESSNTNDAYHVSDLTRYKTSQTFYISLSWQFNTAYITKKVWKTESVVAYK